MVERLGIVYTPVEVVDFIIHSVDAVLRKEFNRSLSDEIYIFLIPLQEQELSSPDYCKAD